MFIGGCFSFAIAVFLKAQEKKKRTAILQSVVFKN